MSGYTENAIIHHGRLDAGILLISKPFRRADLAEPFVARSIKPTVKYERPLSLDY